MHPSHKLLLVLLLGNLGQNGHGARIVDGIVVSDNNMRFMASLQNGKGHICGGVLISEDFVLTAAHCDQTTSVVLGTYNLGDVSDDMRYDVKLCKYPEYESYTQGKDIMLLKLSRKAQLGEKVTIIELPSGNEDLFDKKMCTVVGWGKTSSYGSYVNELRKASVPIVDNKTCKKLWGRKLPTSVICAGGYETTKGFCQADSGGPLLCNNIPVGVVSFNHDCDYSNSNNKFPNVYTDTSQFLPWIKSVLDKQDCD